MPVTLLQSQFRERKMCLMTLTSLGSFNQFRRGVELQKGIAKNRLVTILRVKMKFWRRGFKQGKGKLSKTLDVILSWKFNFILFLKVTEPSD